MADPAPPMGSEPVEVDTCGDPEAWDHFVLDHAEGSYCHLYGWRAVVENAYGRKTVFLEARRGERLVGVLPLALMSGRAAGNRLVSMPYVDLGGPLAHEDSVRQTLIGAALGTAAELGANAVESRESGEPGTSAAGSRYRFLLELPSGSEELWSTIGGKVRNQIRKSRKSELATERESPEGLNDFYSVFGRNMRDLGSPVHSRRFLAEVHDRFGEAARLYLTRDNRGKPVAGAVGISCGRTLAVPWASALRSARASCPNHSLYWRILEDAVGDGFERFDFGRSTVDTGTYRFKKQWGATPIPLAWRIYGSNSDELIEHSEPSATARLVVGIWKRLPVGLANWIGPRIRGRLSQ